MKLVEIRKNKRSPWKWIIQIRSEGKRVTKEFPSLDSAIEARKIFALGMGFHENHGRRTA